MENKEENSTALLNASVKVEICWGGINGVIYKRKNAKGKIFLKGFQSCSSRLRSVTLWMSAWVVSCDASLVGGACACAPVDGIGSPRSERQCRVQ